MSEEAMVLLANIYGEYVEGRVIEKLKADDIGLSRQAIIKAGNELRTLGYLPQFCNTAKTKGANEIIFYGNLSKEAIEYVEQILNDDEEK